VIYLTRLYQTGTMRRVGFPRLNWAIGRFSAKAMGLGPERKVEMSMTDGSQDNAMMQSGTSEAPDTDRMKVDCTPGI